ncbi:hypothetical protein B0A52_10323 [Exophiala mesophila]|uniref:Fumarylacetoacetase n=1 Tax=Exophiala mesophila TaxID=212818 RepID=A0A438MQD2_EXOME|nr:hypothetical protein B0A52_10323 [Exophiala mesophila]
MSSWVSADLNSGFTLNNLPYGVYSVGDSPRHVGVAVGHHVLDLHVLAREHVLDGLGFDATALLEPTLNKFASLGKPAHRALRSFLQELLKPETSLNLTLKDNQALKGLALVEQKDVVLHLPMDIGDYTDFFVGPHHAENCAKLLKTKGDKFAPNFMNMPLGYHGRASSVVVSGTPVYRPNGQVSLQGAQTLSKCQQLDFEVEFAAFIGRGNPHGTSIGVNEAEDHIFGVVLMNDWSARDIQFAESTPLGPFNGKNFCTTISPWIVPLEALEPFRTAPMHPGPWLPYLTQDREDTVYDIPVDARIQVNSETYHAVRCNTKNVAFSFAQMVAHHTVGGCPMRPGDLLGTGTLSGATREEVGCLLEVSQHGTQPYEMGGIGSTGGNIQRGYLEDGDRVSFSAQATRPGSDPVNLGVCQGQIVVSP